MSHEPLQSLVEARQLADDLLVEGERREERDQPHHGSDPEGDGACRRLEHVVVETVLLIPQSWSDE